MFNRREFMKTISVVGAGVTLPFKSIFQKGGIVKNPDALFADNNSGEVIISNEYLTMINSCYNPNYCFNQPIRYNCEANYICKDRCPLVNPESKFYDPK